jgi:hypothetical protein
VACLYRNCTASRPLQFAPSGATISRGSGRAALPLARKGAVRVSATSVRPTQEIMGVTIHYKGRLRDGNAVDRVSAVATSYADSHGWRSRIVNETPGHSENPDYHGGFRGVVVFPHEYCEPVWLTFDDHLQVEERTKTQFAGSAVHIAVIELFRKLSPEFAEFEINDEGEYWETRDLATLEAHIKAVEDRLQQLLEESPEAQIRVKLPSGDIIDMQRNRRQPPQPSFFQSVVRWFRGE